MGMRMSCRQGIWEGLDFFGSCASFIINFFQNMAIIQMNHYIKARTNCINCEGSSKVLAILEEMFPLYPAHDIDINEALQKYFDQADPQHLRYLQQACFKVPLASLTKVYHGFREKRCPYVSQPRISNYFDNLSFISLEVIEKWLDGDGQYPSKAGAEGLKEKIAQALLNMSQQFGYIPNLERFLLYFPQYLIKVQKFKARFFEQIIQQTSQVTYLSPKNCCFAGLIAAIQIGSPYMMARMANMFLVRGGNPQWITNQKYPQQFKPLFSLFRKISVAPWSVNQNDLNFSNTVWGSQVYFDLITAGIFVLSMSTISLAMGLIPDQPCKLIPIQKLQAIKSSYDKQQYKENTNRNQIVQSIKQMIKSEKILSKQKVQQIQGRQIQSYMKEIAIKLSSYGLYQQFNSVLSFLGLPITSPVNLKTKDNSFFHRYRDVIEKGLEYQRKNDELQDTKFECFKDYCIKGSHMLISMQLKYRHRLGKNQQNMRIFRKMLQVLTYNLCGYHNQSFDYKNNIKLNSDLTMPLKFYVRLLSISPLYINKQVLNQIYGYGEAKNIAGDKRCFELGYLAITVAECKAKLLMSSFQIQLFK